MQLRMTHVIDIPKRPTDALRDRDDGMGFLEDLVSGPATQAGGAPPPPFPHRSLCVGGHVNCIACLAVEVHIEGKEEEPHVLMTLRHTSEESPRARAATPIDVPDTATRPTHAGARASTPGHPECRV